MNNYAQAFLWGLGSALSLPLGALLAFYVPISKKWNCTMLAFGAGALLFALTNEIFGEALCQYDGHIVSMVLLAVGAIAGSFIFFVTNYFIENQGGFLRKLALRYTFLHQRTRRQEAALDLPALPHSQSCVSHHHHHHEGHHPHDTEANHSKDGGPRQQLGQGRRTFSSPAKMALHSSSAPQLPAPGETELQPYHRTPTPNPAPTPAVRAVSHDVPLRRGSSFSSFFLDMFPSSTEVHNPHARHLEEGGESEEQEGGAASPDPCEEQPEVCAEDIEAAFLSTRNEAQIGMAVWLGIQIDAIPESLVIGLLANEGVPVTFIAGVFLSNLPEALSSSVIMRRGGFSRTKILSMWTSTALITGLGAVIGAALFSGVLTEAMEGGRKFVEGLAAGAMLVMVAETALPEAFRHAGNLVGFSTLFGFLAAYAIKLVEVTAGL